MLPQEGSRECRAPNAPAALRAKVESTQASHHGHAGNTRHSPRNGFNGYSALSLVTGLSCHHRRRDACFVANLTPASGRQDHTASPSAEPRSRQAPPASTASRPTSVTIAKRPSWRSGMTAVVNMICAKNEAEYLCNDDWTGQISLIRHEKLDFRRSAGIASTSGFDPSAHRRPHTQLRPVDRRERKERQRLRYPLKHQTEAIMSFGKGALLWLIGIPLPIILLIALFMHH